MKRSPQLEHGYLRYAHELDAALAYADFTKGARIVLREVFAQIYGPAALKTAKISPTVLASTYDSDKGTFGRSIRELTESGVLEKIGECEYRFNKDYGQWTKASKQRLSDREMELAFMASERAMSYKQVSVGSSANRNKSDHESSVGNPANDALAIQPTALAIQPTAGRQSSLPLVGNPANGAHYIEHAHGIENGEIGEASSRATREEFPIYDLPYPDPDDLLMVIESGQHEMPDADARSIWMMVWKAWRSERLCNQFYVRQRRHKPDSWRGGIREARVRKVTPRSIAYVEAIAADLDARKSESTPTSVTAPVRASHRRLSTDPALLPPAKEKKAE